MQIISLNTWDGKMINELLAFFTKYQNVDIFCLQEVHCGPDVADDFYTRIEKHLRETHFGYFRAGHGQHYGLAIFVKKDLSVLEEGDVCIYRNPDPKNSIWHNRNLQYIRINLHQQPITIANVHGFWNGKKKTDTPERIEQSKIIRNFLDHEDMFVIMGDFNLHPDTESFSILEKGLQNLIKEYHISSTRTSLYPHEDKFSDYAFVSPSVEVTDFKVLSDEVSDHAALYLEIQ